MTVKLSVIVPVYNVEKYLPECLDSLMRQTFEDMEIILVNDGSTDHSEIICREYANKDSRIKVFSKVNGGLSDARNFGLSKATASIVGFVDSDDYIDLDMYEYLVRIKERDNSQIAVCGIKMTTSDGHVYMKRELAQEIVADRHNAMKELLKSKRITNSVCNKIFDKALFEGVEFPYGKLYEDEYVTYRIFDKATSVSITNKVFYYYRTSPNSITHKEFSIREFDRVYASQIKSEFIKSHYPNLEVFARRYLVYDCLMAMSKMKRYKKDYRVLTLDIVRKYLIMFLQGENSIFIKLYAVLAAVSPSFTVKTFSMITKIKERLRDKR